MWLTPAQWSALPYKRCNRTGIGLFRLGNSYKEYSSNRRHNQIVAGCTDPVSLSALYNQYFDTQAQRKERLRARNTTKENDNAQN